MVTPRPVLAITPGDMAGVGPELVLRVLDDLRRDADVRIFTNPDVLDAAARCLSDRGLSVGKNWEAAVIPIAVDAGFDVAHSAQRVATTRRTNESGYPFGEAVPAFGRLQYDALIAAIDAAMAGEVDAIVTGPWHKARMADAGLPPTGHTEVLEARTGAKHALMALAGDRLRVALVTTHLPLSQVPGAVTTAGVLECLQILHEGLQTQFGIAAPRIAVCGLNPHAGEGGVLGHEDAMVIAPAVEAARARGWAVDGPWPADTLFPRVVAGLHPADAVLAMYHDQGLVPLKTVHFREAANLTFGLPIIRTSVDHGTAYDLAGTGRADDGSLRYAASLAVRLAARRAFRA